MNRFHWSLISLGLLAFMWWTFFAKIVDSDEGDSYPKEHYLEDISKIYCDMGTAALKRGDFTKAIKSYQETVAMRPAWLEGYDHLGIAYELNNQPELAVKTYAQATSINPQFIDYRLYGNKLPTRPIPLKPLRSIEWTGENLSGKKIFVYAEKDLSTTLMFCRLLPVLRTHATHVYFKPQESLIPLIKAAKFGVVLCNNQTNITELDVDYHTSLLSLQHYLGLSIEDLNAHDAYLKINKEKVAAFHKNFFNNSDIKVGIAWNPEHYMPGVKNNNFSPSLFVPLSTIPGVRLYILQKSANNAHLILESKSKITDLSEELKDMTDQAVAIENLDLLISADATLATLAGALHKQTWFLIPIVNDWRWLDYWNKNTSIWFDNFKKVHQASGKNWQPAFNTAFSKLQELVSNKDANRSSIT